MWRSGLRRIGLYDRVVSEVAELASNEVPNRYSDDDQEHVNENDSVFFLQAGPTGPAKLWVGAGNGEANLAAIRASKVTPEVPFHLNVSGFVRAVSGGRVADGRWKFHLPGTFGAR